MTMKLYEVLYMITSFHTSPNPCKSHSFGILFNIYKMIKKENNKRI